MGFKHSLILSFLILASWQVAFSQSNGEPVFAEGVSGQIDSKERTPVISVGNVVKDGAVVLLVNAYSRDPDTKIYPIKFEVFINNNLVSSQLKPAEQVEPLIVPIDPKIATAPMGYTVHAQIIHPSRTFSSVFAGTVFNSNVVQTMSCDVVLTETDSETMEAVTVTYDAAASDVTVIQNSDTNFQLTMTAKNADEPDLEISAVVDITDSSQATAALTVTQDGSTKNASATGTVESSEQNEVTGLEIRSEDEAISISCSSN